VPRYSRIRIRGLDREGGRHELQLAGFPARVVQHENDHLDGVLFFDRMTSLETLTFLDEYGKHWRE
jgi:peptide deformylase